MLLKKNNTIDFWESFEVTIEIARTMKGNPLRVVDIFSSSWCEHMSARVTGNKFLGEGKREAGGEKESHFYDYIMALHSFKSMYFWTMKILLK